MAHVLKRAFSGTTRSAFSTSTRSLRPTESSARLASVTAFPTRLAASSNLAPSETPANVVASGIVEAEDMEEPYENDPEYTHKRYKYLKGGRVYGPNGKLLRASRLEMLDAAKQNDEPHFSVGLNQVYFPNFSVTLVQTPELHPRFAKFLVPRWISKLDLRDFLWHAYKVRALNIRSWVRQKPIEAKNTGHKSFKWVRGEAVKFMVIEMDEPFVWPKKLSEEALDDAFDVNMRLQTMKERDDKRKDQEQKGRIPWTGSEDMPRVARARSEMAQKARKLLSGEVKWEDEVHIDERIRQSIPIR